MINQKRLLNFFTSIVSIDSTSFHEREICHFLKEKLTELGIAYEEDNAASVISSNCGNLYAFIDGDPSLEPVLFCAHMDTVEPSKNKHAVIHEDGTITSDGTTVLGADDVSGIAAILEGISSLLESGASHRPIELLFTVAEEPYCVGIRAFDCSRLKSKESYVFDLTGPVGTAAHRAPTMLSYRAEYTGLAAHAGFNPQDGIHAIRAAAAAVSRIPCGRFDDLTVNVGTISGGIADNIVPEHCTVTGELRSCCDALARKKLAEIDEILKSAAEEYHASVSITHQENAVAYDTPLDHPVVKRFETACKQLNLPCRLITTYGGSDNNHLAQMGMKGLVIANAMNSCHSCEEYTSIEELTRAASLALALMLG